jgi:hypothetical protein
MQPPTVRKLFFSSHFLSFEIYAVRRNMSTIDLRGRTKQPDSP